MVNYVYQPLTLGDQLNIYIQPFLQPTHHLKKHSIVMIYHQDQLIGINLLSPLTLFPNLKQGIIRHFTQLEMDALNQFLLKHDVNVVLPPFHSGFVTGEITHIESHPDADSLWTCKVNLESTSIQVITNSTKVKVSNRIVVARPGAMLLDGQIIEEGLMMKEKSQGMFCSQKTLGIFPETQVGVTILPDNTPIGKDFYAQ